MHLRYTELITKLMACPDVAIDKIVPVQGSPGSTDESYVVNITHFGIRTYSVYLALSDDHVVPYFMEGHVDDTYGVLFSGVNYWARIHGYPSDIGHEMNMLEMKIEEKLVTMTL
jgi:hypothetical protein